MAEEMERADRVVVVLGEFEWEIENALVAVSKHGVVDIYYEDDGARRRVASTGIGACFIEWESLESLEGVEAEDLPDA